MPFACWLTFNPSSGHILLKLESPIGASLALASCSEHSPPFERQAGRRSNHRFLLWNLARTRLLEQTFAQLRTGYDARTPLGAIDGPSRISAANSGSEHNLLDDV